LSDKQCPFQVRGKIPTELFFTFPSLWSVHPLHPSWSLKFSATLQVHSLSKNNPKLAHGWDMTQFPNIQNETPI
jgi:hypothetical protein